MSSQRQRVNREHPGEQLTSNTGHDERLGAEDTVGSEVDETAVRSGARQEARPSRNVPIDPNQASTGSDDTPGGQVSSHR